MVVPNEKVRSRLEMPLCETMDLKNERVRVFSNTGLPICLKSNKMQFVSIVQRVARFYAQVYERVSLRMQNHQTIEKFSLWIDK